MIEAKVASGNEAPYRAVIMRKDGSSCHVEVRGKAIPYHGRRVRAVALRDLTAWVVAEEAFREIEGRLVRLIQSMPMAVALIDAGGRLRFANSRAEDLLGTSVRGMRPEIAGQVWGMFHLHKAGTDEPYPPHLSPVRRALQGESTVVEDVEIKRGETRIPVEMLAAPVIDEGGEVANVIVVFNDITERKQAAGAIRAVRGKYEDIVENSVTGIFQSTRQGRFITVNPAMAEIWGFSSPAEMVARVDDVSRWYVDPARRDEFRKMMEERGVLQAFEAEIIRADGARRWISVNARAVREPDGAIRYFEGTLTDITERKNAQSALRQSEERYRTLVETSPDSIVVTDLDFKVITANAQAAVMHGFSSPAEMLGTNALDLVAPEDRERARGDGLAGAREGGATTVEYELVRNDGTRFPAGVRASSMGGAADEPDALIIVTRDITERKMAEDELQRINAELEGYAHTVSHDLKGPLAAMMMAGQTLKALLEAGDPEAIAEVAGTIEDSAARATALIEDLLSLAEAGQEPAEITDVDVASVIADILAERAREIEDRGLSVTYADDMGLVRASPTHVYQLFSNLIANGVQHNDSATPQLSLTLEQSDGGMVNYLVRDNGSGIPEELLGRVFMPFAKGESGQTGIGLTIVEKIAGVYGGRVKAYNDDGACFEVSLPAGGDGGVSTVPPLL